MTYATFKATLVGQAARRTITELQSVAAEDELKRLGQIVDMTVDLYTHVGPEAEIHLSAADHALLHGRFPAPVRQ